MRKLLKGVLHFAAPTDVVLPWATKNNKELDRHGRPTRATKIEWLCHFIPNDAYRAYVRSDSNQLWLSSTSWTPPSTLTSSPSSRTNTIGSCCAPSSPYATCSRCGSSVWSRL